MSTVERIIYPSRAEFQKSNDDEVDAAWAIAYLSDLAKKTEPGVRALLRGWTAIKVIDPAHTVTPLEAEQAKAEAVREILLSAGRDALPPEKVAAALLLLLG